MKKSFLKRHRMKVQLTIIFYFFLTFTAVAQRFELGNVSIEELQEKQHPKDTSAVAAILFNKGETSFEYNVRNGFSLQTIVTTRIKIYKKEGYSWATKALLYSIDNSPKESIHFSDAITYNLVSGKIEKSELKPEGIFKDKLNTHYGSQKIILPNVKEGSVIEYKYTIKSTNLVNPREWNFQTAIPVNFSEYKITIPQYFQYNTFTKGFINPEINSVKSQRNISIEIRENVFVGSDNLLVAANYSLKNEPLTETTTTYVEKDIPAMHDDIYVNNLNNYTSSLIQELAAFTWPYHKPNSYALDWNSVAKKIYENDDFGPELKKTGYFDDEIERVIANLTTSEDKMKAIYNYVKTNIKWNKLNGYGCEHGVKTAFKNKLGNVGDINLMLTAMLRFAGLEANPVLVSTRDNGISVFPSRSAFNYVITAVEFTNGKVLLDATEENASPNILPIRDLNWMGRLIRRDGSSEEIDLMPKVLSSNDINMNYSIDAKGVVHGKLQRIQNNYNALLFRNQIKAQTQNSYLENLEEENGKIVIENYKLSNEKNVDAPITETYSFSGSNLCEILQDKIYLNPLLFFTAKENPFKLEKRAYPVDYSYPFSEKFVVTIYIPEGYQVESLPEQINLKMEGGYADFKLFTSVNDNVIQILIQNQIKASIFSTEYYKTLKEYYQTLIETMNEKIVFKKAKS